MIKHAPSVSSFLLAAGFSVSACTAILVPADGELILCSNDDDCPLFADNRSQSLCGGDMICVPSFAEIACGESSFEIGHAVNELYEDTTANSSYYSQCMAEATGERGCPAPCNSGLEINVFDVCDDPDAEIPAVNPVDVGGVNSAGQDVLDQFCRSYFCDEAFVCDTSLANPTCKKCVNTDNVEEFGSGACGTIYLQGEISPVYTVVDSASADCGSKGRADVELGVAPGSP